MTTITVVGAGITGLTSALCLARSGHQVRVFDSVPLIRALGVGINLLPHSVKVLWSLGLQEPLEKTAILTGSLRYFSRHGQDIWQEPRGLQAGYQWPQYSIHRGHLQAVLLDAVRRELGDEAIVSNRRFTHCKQTQNKVTAHFVSSQGEPDKVDAELLIGADGIMSSVRAQFYPDEGNPVYSGQVLWRAVSRWPAIFDGRTMMMIGDEAAKAVIYPIAQDGDHMLTNWIAERRIDKALPKNKGDWNTVGNPDDFLPYFSDWRFDWLDVAALFASAEQVFEFPMVDRNPLKRWSFNRVTLAGDAAHAMRPNGSNGASQGILDAQALAKALDEHPNVVAALQAYEHNRIDPTARLTLANRQTGPERILEIVADRCPNGFENLEDHVSTAELEHIAENYKTLAGFSLKQLQQMATQQ